MDVSAFVLHGVEMTLGYQEPVLWPADLIFTAALLETRSVPKTGDVVWFLISPFEKKCVCWPGGACSALACVYFCLRQDCARQTFSWTVLGSLLPSYAWGWLQQMISWSWRSLAHHFLLEVILYWINGKNIPVVRTQENESSWMCFLANMYDFLCSGRDLFHLNLA